MGSVKNRQKKKWRTCPQKTYRLLFRVIRPLVKNIRDDLRAVRRTSIDMLGELKKISKQDKGKDKGGDKKGADFGLGQKTL